MRRKADDFEKWKAVPVCVESGHRPEGAAVCCITLPIQCNMSDKIWYILVVIKDMKWYLCGTTRNSTYGENKQTMNYSKCQRKALPWKHMTIHRDRKNQDCTDTSTPLGMHIKVIHTTWDDWAKWRI